MKRRTFSIMTMALLAGLLVPSCNNGVDNRPVLIYRSWDTGTEGENNEERQLIQAFEKKEGVRVKIVENPGSGTAYWEGIDASVFTKNDLADVFMTPNIDYPLKSQYALNIKEYVEADPEFNKVPASVREACKFKSGYYALPARLNLQGYFANTALIEETLNIDCENLNVNSSHDKIEEIIDKAATVDSVIGGCKSTWYIDTMASVLDEDPEKKQGFFTWDGSQYHLDEAPFINGVKMAKELFASHKVLQAYSDEELETLEIDTSGDLDAKIADAWNKGKLALRFGYTYEMKDMIQKKLPTSSYKFIGNPGGKISLIGDYYCVYAKTEKPELAYKLAKWMSFGMDGFRKRMELYRPTGSVNSLPLQNDTQLINDYFDMYGSSTDMRGLEDAYEYIKTSTHSMTEGVKVVPAYNASRFKALTGIAIGETDNIEIGELLNQCVVGDLDISVYVTGSTNINTIANAQYTNWMNRYGKLYD